MAEEAAAPAPRRRWRRRRPERRERGPAGREERPDDLRRVCALAIAVAVRAPERRMRQNIPREVRGLRRGREEAREGRGGDARPLAQSACRRTTHEAGDAGQRLNDPAARTPARSARNASTAPGRRVKFGSLECRHQCKSACLAWSGNFLWTRVRSRRRRQVTRHVSAIL